MAKQINLSERYQSEITLLWILGDPTKAYYQNNEWRLNLLTGPV